MATLGKILCAIGLHSWREVRANLMLTDSLRECRRCGIGHLSIGYGQTYCRYTKDQMARMWK